MIIRSFRVDVDQIGYVRWCVEAYDGIANASTRAGTPDIIDMTIAPDFLADAEALIDALADEIGAVRVPPPAVPPLAAARRG